MSTAQITVGSAPFSLGDGGSSSGSVIPNSTAHDLMLLQLCFDVGEFDDAEASPISSQQQQLPAFDPFAFVASRQQHVPLEQLETDLEKYRGHLNAAMLTCVHDQVYESFTHVAAQLGNTSKRLGTVKAPLAHTQRRLEHSAAAVTASVQQVNSALDAAVEAELERRFFAARIESALLARQMQSFFTSTAATSPLVAALSSAATPRRQATSAVAAASPGNTQHTQQQQQLFYSPSTVSALIAEKLPGACQSMHRLDELVADMRSCMNGDAQRLEIAAFAEKCAELEAQLLSMMCVAFDSCYQHHQNHHHHPVTDVTNDNSDILDLSSLSPSSASSSSSPVADMQRLCELFCAVGRAAQFVDHFRDAIVRPLVEDVLSWRAASQARASPEDAAKLLERLNSALETGPLGIVPLLQRALAGGSDDATATTAASTAAPLIIIASWAATSDTLMKRAIFLFNAGTPAHYYKHYVAANKLLSAHEVKCSSATELCALRTCAEVSLWTRKWNAEVYHALRQSELNDLVSKALSAPDTFAPSASPSSSSSGFQTAAFTAVFDAVKRTIDPDGGIFLFALQHRFLRDVCASIQALVAKSQGALEGGGGGGGGGSENESSTNVVALWGRIRHDLQALSNSIATQFPPLLEAGTSGAWSDANSAILSPQAFVALLVEEVGAAVEQLDAVVKAGVVRRCMSNLSSVRLVPAAFTMTNKSVPSEPSAFTRNALAPLKNFHTALLGGGAVVSQLQQRLIEDAASDILGQYSVVIKELVISSKKSQESFENMKRARLGKAGAAATAAATAGETAATVATKQKQATDRDKIIVQLHFDIGALATELRSMGIHKERFGPFKQLEGLVKQRAEWVLSGYEGDEPDEIIHE